MHTYRLVVGPDGTLRVPDAQPGQIVTVQVEAPPTAATPEREMLTLATAGQEQVTLATAKTPEERAEVIARIRANGRKLRELLKDDLPTSTDELYDEDGLPA
ncbi:MAG: hypothetical protein WBA46_04685 [Thermomicrobiales bacterium]